MSNNIISSENQPKIFISGGQIYRKSELMFLGVVLDEKLKFDHHISYISKKIAKSVGIIYELKQNVPIGILKTLYFSFVYPHLTYCVTTWGSTYESHLKPIVLLQKKIIRMVANVEYLSHTNPLFYNFELLKFQDIYNLAISIFMYKNKNSPIFQSEHNYVTRNRDLAQIPFQRLTLTQHSIYHTAPVFWNKIPDRIKRSRSIGKFKFEMKRYLLGSYDGD